LGPHQTFKRWMSLETSDGSGLRRSADHTGPFLDPGSTPVSGLPSIQAPQWLSMWERASNFWPACCQGHRRTGLQQRPRAGQGETGDKSGARAQSQSGLQSKGQGDLTPGHSLGVSRGRVLFYVPAPPALVSRAASVGASPSDHPAPLCPSCASARDGWHT
jgi:hypothetical protein